MAFAALIIGSRSDPTVLLNMLSHEIPSYQIQGEVANCK